MANNIIKMTTLIVLSASIYSCSQPDTKTSQPQVNQPLSTNVKTPNWDNISLKSVAGHNNTILVGSN